jgi:class 3 adenylate cyclase/tetratricopeptide (TPR) repeat protein/DNA-binding XRE family transcriptional regulator
MEHTDQPLHSSEPSDRLFGDILRQLRRAAGWTQAELAERANLSLRGIADLERGINRHPRRETVLALAEALELSKDTRHHFIAAARGRSPDPLVPDALLPPTSTAEHPGSKGDLLPPPILPTGTVTFLFTDIDGSTQLLRHLGDRYAAVLSEHQRLLRKAWADHGGAEVDTAGDGFFVAFPTAPAAVAAAAAATRALARHSWPEDGALRVRMGLHTGSPQLMEDRYVGLDVHRAARIAAAGHGGQILLSSTTRELVANTLPEGATLRDLGTYQLKDFTQPEHLYQLILPGLPDTFPRLKTLDRPPHDLPPRAPGFVGREADIAALTSTLGSRQAVAIVGLGGLGKSSLAAEVIYALAGDPAAFPGGVVWVRCDGRMELDGLVWLADQLLAAWGAPFGVEATAHDTTPEEALAMRERALRERLRPDTSTDPLPSLVLLDNVEHGLPLARLLAAMQPLGITPLLTMRGEPSPPHVYLLRLETLAPDAAVQLFAERYVARGGSWVPERDGAMAAAIAAALGGLPLAIELAAARAARTRLPLATVAEELRGRDALSRLSDPRSPSTGVRYSLSKTFAALTLAQRTRFAALGLPQGPDWALLPIERMLAGVPAAPLDQSDADRRFDLPSAQADLEALVAYSLVGLVAGAGGSAPRVRLHPLVRELAREEWARQSAADQQAALQGLLAGVHEWLLQYQDAAAGVFEALAPDEDLIAGALRTAFARQVGLPQVLSIVEAWDLYLWERNHRLDLEMRLLQLEGARTLGDRRAELHVLNRLVRASGFSGREEEAARYRRAALALAHELGDRVEILRMLGAIADETAARGSRAEAEELYAEAQALARELGESFTDFDAQNNIGNAARTLDRLDDAAQWYQRGIASAHAAGDELYELMIKSNLATVYDYSGQLVAARTLLEEIAQFRHTHYPYGVGGVWNALGQLALKMGNLEEAARYLTDALPSLEQSRSLGGPAEVVAQAQANLILLAGLQALRQGDREAAGQAFEQALQQFEAVGRLADAVDQRPFARRLLADLRDSGLRARRPLDLQL